MTPINLVQPGWQSDSNHVLLSLQAATGAGTPVKAMFRGGRSIEIHPGGQSLGDVERAYRDAFGFPQPATPINTPRWRTQDQAYADEQAALAGAAQ